MSNNKCENVSNKKHINIQDSSKPIGALTFEGVISKFNGKAADKYDKKILLVQSILGALVVTGIVLCFIFPEIWMDYIAVIVVLALLAVGLFPFGYFGNTLVEIPYGRISYSMGYILYPKIDVGSGKASNTVVELCKDLGVHDTAQDFYVSKVKHNPVLWLQYMFYREQIEDLENITTALPQPPTAEQELLGWYKSQRDHYYNLFINAHNNAAQ